MVHSSDGDTDFFYIVFRILQENTLVQYLLMICWDYVQKISIDLKKMFHIKKKLMISRRNQQMQTMQMI